MESLCHLANAWYNKESYLEKVENKKHAEFLWGSIAPDFILSPILRLAYSKSHSELVKLLHKPETYAYIYNHKKLDDAQKNITIGSLVHTIMDLPSDGSPSYFYDLQKNKKLKEIEIDGWGTMVPWYLHKSQEIVEDVKKTFNVPEHRAWGIGHNIIEFAHSYLLAKNNPEIDDLSNLARNVDLRTASNYLSEIIGFKQPLAYLSLWTSLKLSSPKANRLDENFSKIAIPVHKRVIRTSESRTLIRRVIDKCILDDYADFENKLTKYTEQELKRLIN